MSGTAIATMILICGVVWGGFALLLSRAVRHEGWKREAEEAPPRERSGDDRGAAGGG
jgi:hypothetical protein